MGVIAYWVNVFRLPQQVIASLERLMVHFLWLGNADKGSYKVSWKVVCKSREEGDLGLCRLDDWNKAALMCQIWNVASKSSNCWTQFIQHRWLKRHSIWSLTCPTQCSSSFKAILETRQIASLSVRYLIKNGEGTLLWYDPWLPNGPLTKEGCEGFLVAEALGRRPFDSAATLLNTENQWEMPNEYPALDARWNEISATKIC
ncbi:uncharacterized protein LOC122638975 [Telopea speciosissima]|uniref:uncharacterized protein LOC122638975 n=1 Tax=Telopea speciosissima TaxID=54955 RepID=UPI001CC33320|nr:uncharacterized protein LOC122638975 [Telopea speciosissima]